MGKTQKPGNKAKHNTCVEPGEQLFPNKVHHTSLKQTSKKYANIRVDKTNTVMDHDRGITIISK